MKYQAQKKYAISKPYSRTIANIRQRCNNPNDPKFKYYGGKGIKSLISLSEIEIIWKRDNAHKMKQPSIDRINKNGHYEFSNCRFIEMTKNRGGIPNPRTTKPIKPNHCYWCGKKNPKAWTKFCSRKCALNSARLAWLERNRKSKGGSK